MEVLEVNGYFYSYNQQKENILNNLEPEFLVKAIFNKMLHRDLLSLKITCKQFSQTIVNHKSLSTYLLAVKLLKFDLYPQLENAKNRLERAQAIVRCTAGLDSDYNQEISHLIQGAFKRYRETTSDNKLNVLNTIIPLLAPVCPEGLVKLADSFDLLDYELFKKIGIAIGDFKKTFNFIDQCEILDENKISLFGEILFNETKSFIKNEENVGDVIDFVRKYGISGHYIGYYSRTLKKVTGNIILGAVADEILKTNPKLAEKVINDINEPNMKRGLLTDLILAIRDNDFKNSIKILSDAHFYEDSLNDQLIKAKILEKTLFKYDRFFIPSKISFEEYKNLILKFIDSYRKDDVIDTHSIAKTRFEMIQIWQNTLHEMYECFLINAPLQAEAIENVIDELAKEHIELHEKIFTRKKVL